MNLLALERETRGCRRAISHLHIACFTNPAGQGCAVDSGRMDRGVREDARPVIPLRNRVSLLPRRHAQQLREAWQRVFVQFVHTKES